LSGVPFKANLAGEIVSWGLGGIVRLVPPRGLGKFSALGRTWPFLIVFSSLPLSWTTFCFPDGFPSSWEVFRVSPGVYWPPVFSFFFFPFPGRGKEISLVPEFSGAFCPRSPFGFQAGNDPCTDFMGWPERGSGLFLFVANRRRDCRRRFRSFSLGFLLLLRWSFFFLPSFDNPGYHPRQPPRDCPSIPLRFDWPDIMTPMRSFDRVRPQRIFSLRVFPFIPGSTTTNLFFEFLVC